MSLIHVNGCVTQGLDGVSDRDALLFPPSQQSYFLGRWDFRNRQDLEAHLCQIREAEFVCGDLRYIDYSSVDEGATIGDPHDCGTPVFLIVDVDQCPERE